MDVSKLAERFGGGGHKLASGARTNEPLPQTRDAVLAAVEAALGIEFERRLTTEDTEDTEKTIEART